MKTTVTCHDFINAFESRGKGFSRAALRALFDHLGEIERESATEMELDVIAICCDWTEYPSAIEAAEAYGWESEHVGDERADTSDRDALEFLTDNTTVLEIEGGAVVVQNY